MAVSWDARCDLLIQTGGQRDIQDRRSLIAASGVLADVYPNTRIATEVG